MNLGSIIRPFRTKLRLVAFSGAASTMLALLAVSYVFAQKGQNASPSDPYGLIFFNVSDAHIVADSEKNTWRLSKDSADIVRKVLQQVGSENPDMVLFSGDVIEGKFYGMKSLKLASKILQSLTVPWFVVAGNHDGRYTKKENTIDEFQKSEFYKEFKGHGPDGKVGYWSYDVPQKLITFIGLDTSKDGVSAGRVEGREIEWLQSILEQIPKERLVIVVMHHPAVVFNPVILDSDKNESLKIFVLDNQEEVRTILEAHKNVKLVISGHTHAPGYLLLNGIHYVSSPAINSWPCLYTRFSINRSEISYRHVPIPDKDKIAEALEGLVRSDSIWMGIFKEAAAVKTYFTHGPMQGVFKIN